MAESHLFSLFLRCGHRLTGGFDAGFEGVSQMIHVLRETGDMTPGDRLDLHVSGHLAPTRGGVSAVPKFQFTGPQNRNAAIIGFWNKSQQRSPVSIVSSFSTVMRCCKEMVNLGWHCYELRALKSGSQCGPKLCGTTHAHLYVEPDTFNCPH